MALVISERIRCINNAANTGHLRCNPLPRIIGIRVGEKGSSIPGGRLFQRVFTVRPQKGQAKIFIAKGRGVGYIILRVISGRGDTGAAC